MSMSKKRGRPMLGSLRDLPNGKCELWYGKKYWGVYASRAEAQIERDEVNAARVGTSKPPKLIKHHARKWLESSELAAQADGGGSDYWRNRRTMLDAHIATAPWWEMEPRSFTAKHAQAWINAIGLRKAQQTVWVAGTDGGPKTLTKRATGRLMTATRVRDIVGLARRMIDAIVVDGHMSQNPLRIAKLPTRVERLGKDDDAYRADDADDGERDDDDDDAVDQLIVHLTAPEIARLFALELEPHIRCAYAIAVYCGLRRSELLGLRLRDIQLAGPRPMIRVRRGYNRRLKSKRARRNVPLLPQAAAAIRAYLEHIDAVLGARPIGHRHLFMRTDTKHGARHVTRGAGERFAKAYDFGWRRSGGGGRDLTPRARAGLRDEITFHCLRHTCGTHLLKGTWTPRRLDIQHVSRWLGHASTAVTERHYASLTTNDLHAQLDGLHEAAGLLGEPAISPGLVRETGSGPSNIAHLRPRA